MKHCVKCNDDINANAEQCPKCKAYQNQPERDLKNKIIIGCIVIMVFQVGILIITALPQFKSAMREACVTTVGGY